MAGGMTQPEHERALNEGYRNALALLVAIDTGDEDARLAIWRGACGYHLSEALLTMLLGMIDDHYGGDVTGWVRGMKIGLEL